MPAWRQISLWMNQLDEPLQARLSLAGEHEADIAIIGAGYTGLWTAYYLKTRAPALKIVILEAETAGFGASGRNGGWLMGAMLNEGRLIGGLPAPRRRASWDLLHGIPDEVARVLAIEGIACDYRKGGMLDCAARYPEQERRLRAYLTALRQQGLGEEDYRWLNPAELATQLRIPGAMGAIYTPHCATINPAKLARGLAQAVERLGVQIFEMSEVINWAPGRLHTAQGSVRAAWVVPAVEGYAPNLPPLGRYQLPVQSLMVATEPLADSVWDEIGLAHGQAFSEHSRQVTYGQRTSDNRLAFGARGGYRFGGTPRGDFTLSGAEIQLRRTLFSALFPQLRDVTITHGWGGNLGMSRRFQPQMLVDRRSAIALAGGYGGEGVGAANLAGRTLADLILGRDSPETHQPWVINDRTIQDALRPWEPEPLRWLGYKAIIESFAREDEVLANPATPAWRRRMAEKLADSMEKLMH